MRLVPIVLLLAGTAAYAETRSLARVPMRDGVRLSTNVFVPGGAGPFSAILIRTPYGKGEDLIPSYKPFIEQRLAPVAERTAKPGVDGNLEAHLRAIDERAGHVAVEHAPKHALATAPLHLHRTRKRPCELDDAVVQQRLARLEAGGADGHSGRSRTRPADCIGAC